MPTLQKMTRLSNGENISSASKSVINYLPGEIMLDDLFQIFSKQKWTLSAAESCTGGLFSARLTETPGVSAFFRGAVVCYSNDVKTDILGVSSSTLKHHGAVSLETASEMAEGVRSRLKSHWSVAITGIAGPSGGSAEKPIGTVCFAVSGQVGAQSFLKSEKKWFAGDRLEIRDAAVEFAFQLLLECTNSLQ